MIFNTKLWEPGPKALHFEVGATLYSGEQLKTVYKKESCLLQAKLFIFFLKI